MPLGHIQHQRPGGARMARNNVVPIWHIRRLCPDGVNMAHKTRRQRPGGAKMALATTTLTTSMTGGAEWSHLNEIYTNEYT